MAEYIDRQTAIDALGERPVAWTDNGYNLGCVAQYDLNRLAIETVPSADAVKVVRCRDCKWSDWYTAVDGKQYCYCMETGVSALMETDYCSFGERKDGDTDG